MLALKMGGFQQKTNTGTFDGDSEFVTQTTRPVESKSGGLVNGKKLLATEFIHDKLNLIHNLNPEGASWIYIKIKTFNYNIGFFFQYTIFPGYHFNHLLVFVIFRQSALLMLFPYFIEAE